MARIKTISGFIPYSHMAARVTDVVALIAGGYLAYFMRFGTLDNMIERYHWMMLSGALLGMIIFRNSGVYRSWRGAVRVELVVRIARCFAILGAAIFTYLYFTKTGVRFSRAWLGIWLTNAFVISVGIRAVAYPVLNRIRSQGHNRKTVMMIGDLESCAFAVQKVKEQPSTGFDIIGARLMDASGCDALDIADCQAFDTERDGQPDADEVWICLPISRGSVVEKILETLKHCTKDIRYMPDVQGLRLLNHDLSSVAGLYLLDMSCSPMSGTSRWLKAVEDRVLSALILLALSPIMLLVALAVKLTSRGPVFYRQERMGWNGKSFKMLKFRTMPTNVEAKGVEWGQASNKQTTLIGGWLRRSSLDELPQLINVLKGEMSIVGPRPERTVFVDEFKEKIPGYMQKHMMNAGITGWAQVQGWRGDTDLSKRIECDLWYIENWSLWLDLKIIVMTLWHGFFHPHAR
uniref:undecaprenyl-phosphate glucose phosphotransferase n=1 Tax=Halomonas sp. TaxID=1486246 RepID=UPI0026186D83|nr:undecaprenyl-phosphate glucose phosphotransferase [Halomonas sp.]